MTLVYRLLIVDDQAAQITGAINRLKGQIEQEGFFFEKESATSAPTLEGILRRPDLKQAYDLILVDKNLGADAPDGASAIKRLRHKIPHTPVIFYSSDPKADLWERICAEKIEGVFRCGRTELYNEAYGIFHAYMHSLLRPHAVRGFFVGAVSELDALARNVALQLLEKLSEPQRSEINNYIDERLK